ncbi:MAG TPA: DUF4325 domain-containing protein [Phycisphaeraceae bacterium]|nr:DUF4325 domain-containing protein [Phycisphaeraceae bacterium]
MPICPLLEDMKESQLTSSTETTFRLLDHGEVFSSRDTGTLIRSKIMSLFNQLDSNAVLVIDISEVTTLTPSFADECFGRLVSKVGLDVFRKKFRFKVIRDEHKVLINTVVRNRIALDRIRGKWS